MGWREKESATVDRREDERLRTDQTSALENTNESRS